MSFLSTTPSTLRAWLLAGAASFALLGCGGGDDGGTPTPTPNPGGGGGGGGAAVQILDSFGQVVAAGGADGVGVGDSGADGTAGEGAPIVGGTVTVTDVNGKTASATTDAQGYYRLKVTGFVAPFVAKVTKADGKVLRSLNLKAPVTNAFITLNLTGLTDKVASDVAKAAGKAGAADLTPQIVAANPAAVTTAINNLASLIQPVISAAGITSFDPLSAAFRPNHTGYDFVLDNVKVTVDANGATVVAISPTFPGGGSTGLSGTWGIVVAVTIQGQTQTAAGADIPGAGIPKDGAAASAFCQTGYSQTFNSGGTSGTVTCNGNTITVVSSSGTLNATYNFVSYQGCGACGVGSTVVVTYNVAQTFSFSGGSSSDNYSVVMTYTRKS
ncbi:MAG: hypothetical protein ABIR26_08660 [Ramlibacter sp.]